MRSQIQARADTAERRQKLQIGGGVLLVALIWTVALWPSGDQEPASQGVPAPQSTYTPWTTGPFVGTTPTTSTSSIPTVLDSTVPTVRTSGGAPALTGRPAAPATSPGGTRAPAPAPSTTSAPTKKGNSSGKPPKPNPPTPDTESTGLLDTFGL